MFFPNLFNFTISQSHAAIVQQSSERATTSFPLIKEEVFETTTSHRSLSLDFGVVSQSLEVTNSKDKIAELLHAAYHVACGIRQRSILPGDPKVSTAETLVYACQLYYKSIYIKYSVDRKLLIIIEKLY